MDKNRFKTDAGSDEEELAVPDTEKPEKEDGPKINLLKIQERDSRGR